MTPKPVVLRAVARRDVDEASAHYQKEGSVKVALGFIDALEGAFRHIAAHPESGSPHYGHELNLPGLRSWPLKRFPFLVFYMGGGSRIDVWRVLHSRRDIPEWMREEVEPD
ncbi:MAG: type II toxin-antitoxin system RelE/ParE family toxin [Acidobacteriota bacterium]|nr:type II toxin-antitoxin system RelE/ParE family toxin [Acidobacteriota bacterium]MDE3261922.1 type II toxin-antitoxin system RelE/ParE family toxin [Acidobacteriota bacterium]